MPKYSFKCKACNEVFSVNCKYEVKWDSTCPKCGGSEKTEVFRLEGHGYAQSVTERMGITEIPPHGHFFGEK